MTQNITTPQQPTPPVSPITPTYKPKSRGMLFMGGILILGLGFTIGLLFSKNLSPASQISPTPTPLLSPTPQAKPESLPAGRQVAPPDTTNWKTYSSTLFSFKYDPSLYLDQITERDTEVTLYNKDPRLPYQKNVYYLYFGPTQNATFVKEINLIKQGSPNVSYTSWRLNDYTIYEVKGLLVPTNVNEIHYFVEGNGKLTDVRLGNGAETSEPEYIKFSKTSDQILSTFRFLRQDPNSEGKFCGGIAGNLPQNQCPKGYTCQLEGNYPDAGGRCEKP